jgi:GDP-4-dehydro-6-deoxy-D-mannose reductase
VKTWVTGADGFVGRHLVAAFRAAGDEVHEAHGPHAPGNLGLDVRDAAAVAARVAEVKPAAIVHLAGASSVAASHADPAGCLAVNAGGTLNVLAAVRAHAPSARVLLVSSGEVYGAQAGGVPAPEEAALQPLSPYAASKVAAEVLGLQFHRAYGLDVVVARPFNHLGAGQAASFVVPSFARQLVDIRRGRAAPVLKVGNLSPVRDFSHVLDVVAGYRVLLGHGRAGEAYNVCSGEGLSIRTLLEALCRRAGVEVSVEVDAARVRPVELPWLVGAAGKLEALGWRRSHPLEEALDAVLAEAATPSPP